MSKEERAAYLFIEKSNVKAKLDELKDVTNKLTDEIREIWK